MKSISFIFSLLMLAACTSEKPQIQDTSTQSTDTAAQTSTETSAPTVCTESSEEEGACLCSAEEGFTTYSFPQDDYERCFTTYIDPQMSTQPLPLLIQPDCYTANGLQSPGSARFLSSHLNIRTLELTSPTGNWQFPLNNEVNAENYELQCDAESSREIEYLQGVFSVVDQMIADGLVDENKIYISGFSQNSMFAIFAATCFPDRIAGINQGGSGLYSQAEGALALPQCEGVCTRSAFEEFDQDCVTEEPCESCEFFPVYPSNQGATFQSCLFMYDNDNAAHSTAVPAHKHLTQEGHSASLHIFASHSESGLGGHEMPMLNWEWVNSCLSLNESCSTECETAVTTCVDAFQTTYATENNNQNPLHSPEGRESLLEAYRGCLMTSGPTCTRGCAATEAMLHSVEPPSCTCAPEQSDCECTTSDTPGPCQNQ